MQIRSLAAASGPMAIAILESVGGSHENDGAARTRRPGWVRDGDVLRDGGLRCGIECNCRYHSTDTVRLKRQMQGIPSYLTINCPNRKRAGRENVAMGNHICAHREPHGRCCPCLRTRMPTATKFSGNGALFLELRPEMEQSFGGAGPEFRARITGQASEYAALSQMRPLQTPNERRRWPGRSRRLSNRLVLRDALGWQHRHCLQTQLHLGDLARKTAAKPMKTL